MTVALCLLLALVSNATLPPDPLIRWQPSISSLSTLSPAVVHAASDHFPPYPTTHYPLLSALRSLIVATPKDFYAF